MLFDGTSTDMLLSFLLLLKQYVSIMHSKTPNKSDICPNRSTARRAVAVAVPQVPRQAPAQRMSDRALFDNLCSTRHHYAK
jgi:hypothetical protein